MTWQIQSSVDYMENDISIKLGKDEWIVYQKFSAQANLEEQELIFKIDVSSPTTQQEYAIDFHHKVMLGYVSNFKEF